jgi:hypothetical protein
MSSYVTNGRHLQFTILNLQLYDELYYKLLRASPLFRPSIVDETNYNSCNPD